MAGTTLQTLVERVANRKQMLDTMTVAAGSTATVVKSTGIYQADNWFKGGYLFVKTVAAGAAPQDEEQQVTSSSLSGTSATVGVAFTTTPPTGSTIQLYRKFSHAMIVNAINDSIREATGFWFRENVNETKTTAVNTFSYDLSALSPAIEERYGVHSASFQVNTSYATYPYALMRDGWLRWDNGTPTLQFERLYPSSRTLRIQYITSPTTMSVQTDTHGIAETKFLDQFIENWAIAYLFEGRWGFSPAADHAMDTQIAKWHRDEAERIRRLHSMRIPPHRIKPPMFLTTKDDGRYLGGYATPSA